MSADPAHVRARSSSPGAERMRLYRKRRREGSWWVRVPLDAPEIDGLIRLKLLRKERRRDPEALQGAVMSIIYRVLEGGG
jgi:hypothetical protein